MRSQGKGKGSGDDLTKYYSYDRILLHGNCMWMHVKLGNKKMLAIVLVYYLPCSPR